MKKIIAFLLSAMMLAAMFVVVAPAESVNVAANKTATAETVVSGELAALTDGAKGEADATVTITGAGTPNDGWTWDGEIFIFTDIDLGSATQITEVSVFMTNSAWDLLVFVSEDGENWTFIDDLGSLQNHPVEGTAELLNPKITFEATTARYVRVGFGAGSAPSPIVTEIEVIGEGTAAEAPSTPDDATSDDAADDATSAPAEESEKEPATPSQPGDASNMIVFAVIALVAIAGSAVVIKSRG